MEHLAYHCQTLVESLSVANFGGIQMSFVEQIQRRIYAKTSLYGTWLPSDPIQVGEYGYIRKGRFNREGNLKSRGIELSVSRISLTPSSLGFSDRASFNSKVGATAKAANVGSATLEIGLSGEGAFVYHLQDLVAHRVADKEKFFHSLFMAIMSEKLKWRDEFVVIDETREAGAATLLVLESDAGKIKMKGKIPSGAEAVAPLAKIDANVSVDVESGSIFQIKGENGTTPLYSAKRLKFGPDGPPGPAVAMSQLVGWVKEKIGYGVFRIDAVRQVDYVTDQERDIFTYELNDGSHQRFTIVAEQVDIDTFLELGREVVTSEEGLLKEIESIQQADYAPRYLSGGG